MPDFQIRQITLADRDWVRRAIVSACGAEIVVAHKEIFHPADLPGLATFAGEEPIGLLTYNINMNECEIITLDSWSEGRGVGTGLINAVQQMAGRAGCKRLFLVTTNNNTHALRFYQKRGFVISAMRFNAIAENRKIKPQIPLLDKEGLPIRDEIELEILLNI